MKRTVTILALACLAALSAPAWEPSGNNIRTRWAAEVSPQNARPEYPRPQMVRPQWKNLNGLWNYAVTDSAAVSMPGAEGQILVPFCIESSLSGVGRRVDGSNAVWYSTEIQAPAGWDGKKVLLHFDAVDWKAEIFVNGDKVCEHTGGYTGFSCDVTGYLKDGPAKLVVRAWDPTDDPAYSIPRGKQVQALGKIWYTPVTGIWQTVWMEAVPVEGYIADYNVATDIAAGTISVTPVVEGARKGDFVKVEVLKVKKGYNPEKPGFCLFRKGRAMVAAGETAAVRIRRPKLWTPDTPYLYGLRISLVRDGKVIDKVNAYTAMREISKAKDSRGDYRLALNGDIVFQFGPLDQGWWPDGLYTAPTAEAMLFDIVKTKELGFNMIRKHVKVEPSRWYYDCDREGIMVWQDMPAMGHYTSRDQWSQGADVYGAGKDYWALTDFCKENYYKEWGEVLDNFKKFQSIVAWVPFNEAWGQFDTKAVCEWTKAKDPSRLINSASGGNWVEGAGDILDSHYYPNPVMRIIDTAMVNVLGEFGGIGRPVEGHVWEIDKKWGYVQYDSEEKVTDTYVLYAGDLLDIKQNDKCAAAVYTQTTDVEGEVNGFLTYDREVLKLNLERVREANRKVIESPEEPLPALVPAHNFHYQDPGAGLNRHLNLYTLRNGELIMQVTDFGARIISFFAPDRNGRIEDIAVGYDDALRYVHNSGERFLGATVGRVANRIGKGRFSLDGRTYWLPLNNNGQTLHGGLKGVDMVVWKVYNRTASSITFAYTAPDSQDGFPGNLDIKLTYTLTEDNCLDIKYEAVTDKATPVNLSNHAFFNLKGAQGGTILDHNLIILADGITPVDAHLIPTGEIMPVEGTPFDFREAHKIGERIGEGHSQLVFGNGYDHNWVLSAPCDGQLHKACELSEDSSGRVLEIFTDQPGIQFYAGNFFDGTYNGKYGKPIGFREALTFETQKFPNAVNNPQFPNTVLRPGETYTHHSVYKFSVR